MVMALRSYRHTSVWDNMIVHYTLKYLAIYTHAHHRLTDNNVEHACRVKSYVNTAETVIIKTWP